MKKGRDYADSLNDILVETRAARHMVAGLTFEEFAQDSVRTRAVIRSLEVIGEATKQIPLAVRKQNSQIPWREIAGMRDKLIHEYFGVSLRRVWQTVREDLPPLETAVEKMISELGDRLL